MSSPALSRPPLGFLMLLGMMAAVPAMTLDMYLPALPEMARDLSTTQALAQGTISGVMIGSAVGQLFNGPLSDRFGRRRPFFAGMALHIVMSVLCAISPNIYMLLGVRMLQGAGNAAATIAAFSALRDRFAGPAQSSGMSWVQSVIAVVPLAAPALGGFIAHHFGWRAVFLTLAVFGLVVMGLVAALLEETHPPERRSARGAPLFATLTPLLRDARFLTLVIVPAMSTTVLLTYVSASSFVLQEGYGLTPGQFVIVFSINGLMIILGAQVNSRFVYRVGTERMLWIGIAGSLVFAVALLVTAWSGAGGVWGFSVPLALLLAANFLTLPNAVTLALQRHAERAGSATALMGAIQQFLAGVLSPLVAVFGGGALAMAIVLLGAVVLAAVFGFVTRGLERR
ncbi:MAG: multidrug effflux MFS transporter [bacterium]|nr:multidrug effflux MFS transporter [bacterium]